MGLRAADLTGQQWTTAGDDEGPVRYFMHRTLRGLFDAAVRTSYRVEVSGLAHYTRARPTLIVATHRRDTDGPLLGSALIERHGRLPVGRLPHFVAREDLFRRGFLREYLTGWPAPLREFLGLVNVAPVLDLLHAHPMRRIPERSLWETLEDVREVCGDLPLSQVLRPRWVEQFQRLAPRARPELKVSEALRRRYRPLLRRRHGLSKLTLPCFRAIAEYERRAINAQLDRFVALLDRGESVQLEPEGTISTNGDFHRIRSGLYTLLTHPRRPPHVLPVGITYDFMCTGSARVFVNVGPELVGLEALPRREVNARVAGAIRTLTTVTVSQLASSFLLRCARGASGLQPVSIAELEGFVEQQAAHWRRSGLHVDPRAIDPRRRRVRLRGYLRYCLRHGTLVRRRGALYVVTADSADSADRGPAPSAAQSLRYAENELNGAARCAANAVTGP